MKNVIGCLVFLFILGSFLNVRREVHGVRASWVARHFIEIQISSYVLLTCSNLKTKIYSHISCRKYVVILFTKQLMIMTYHSGFQNAKYFTRNNYFAVFLNVRSVRIFVKFSVCKRVKFYTFYIRSENRPCSIGLLKEFTFYLLTCELFMKIQFLFFSLLCK